MSFILDALNRSGSDAQREPEVPGLQTVHGAPDAAVSYRPVWWMIATLVLLLLGAAGWGVVSLRQTPQPAAASASAKPENRVQPVRAPVTPAGPAAAKQSADIAALYQQGEQQENLAERKNGSSSSVTEIAQAPQSPQAVPSASPPSSGSPGATSDIDKPTDVTELNEPAPAVRPAPASAADAGAATLDSGLDIEALAKAAEAELARQRSLEPVPEESAVPLLSSLRQSVKDEIPSIFYREHSWATNPRERSVVLNKQRYREGQRVGPGLTLVEILENGVVMDFRGTEFRLSTLNSWVNL
ncbi:MAG: general secretion pathway protein GspB [Pseudomonadota bacterium]